MSRLVLLNLPSTLTPQSLRDHLLTPPTLTSTTITDLKLLQKRRLAFVGYKTEDEALKVKDWFHGSFALGGQRVKVDIVRDDPLSARPGKKARVEEVRVEKVEREKKGLKEFMNVMKGVDESMPVASSSKLSGVEGAVPGEKGWVVDEGKKGKGKMPEVQEVQPVQEDDDDAAWLRRRQNAALQVNDTIQPEDSPIDPSTLILSTSRLFIRNLPFVTTPSDLSALLLPFGETTEIHLPVSPQTSQPLGTAFIQFSDPNSALEAYKKLDRTIFLGRLLHVLPGRAKPGQEGSGVVGEVMKDGVLGKMKEGRGDVKKGVDAKRKEEGARGVNWATLYMNSDAVAASVADRMGISKSDLLSSDETNPSVKLALAETHIIAETKQYFLSSGLDIDSLNPKAPRSQTIILVKNIPYGTTIPTLTELFTPHGVIKRVLLPPAGTLGVVEMKDPIEAGRAFRALSYKRLGSAVLYLEKGPTGMFVDKPINALSDEAQDLVDRVAATDASNSDESGSTLFIKNLSFSTTTTRLQNLLSNLPGYSFARVQTKPDGKRLGERLSMGYGFVGFKTRDEAVRGLKGLEGFEVDGKVLEVSFAGRGGEVEEGKKGNGGELEGKTKGTKVLVKNLPFEATKKDVQDLFSAYGTLKSLRLPRKATLSTSGQASTRGFAFLEFTTHKEAVRAMEALKHTHLLGRHLIVEWAKGGEGVDVAGLREKVGRGWKDGGGGTRGKGKGGGKRGLEEVFGGGQEELDGLEG